MNKFKFEPPQEHRRSLQQPKNQHVAITTTLDKCTQILREDRLFLRNQIKNCNPEVLEIFKQFPRASQLQNLQIRLRKYVQNVKNRIKTEQLNKFKETLCMNTIAAEPKRQNNQLKPSQSTLKQPFKPSCSTQLNRTTQYRNNKSQQHSANHMNMNSSLRHFQQILKQKFSQDVIQQRQSQNVTSARQARQEYQQNKPKPLQEQFYDSIQNKIAGKSANFNPFIPNKKIEQNLAFLNDFNKDKVKINQEEPMKLAPWDFQKQAKQVLYQFKNIEKQQEEINPNFCSKSRQKNSMTYQERQDSIFDQHFYGSQKEASQIQPNQYFSNSSHINDVKQPISFAVKDSSALSNSNIFEHSEAANKWSEPTSITFKLKQSDFKTTEEEAPKNKTIVSHIQNSRKSEENLFTPLELLNECRNFLKHRDNSNQKSNVCPSLGDISLSQAVPVYVPTQTFLDLKPEEPMSSVSNHQVDSLKKEEDSAYVFPQIKDSNKKSEEYNASSQIDDNYHYTHFQTFANSHEQKPYLYPAKLPILPIKNTFVGLCQQRLPQNFSIEDFLESLMEVTDMNPFITVNCLANVVNNHENSEPLKNILRPYLEMSKSDEICLTDLSEVINTKYNQEYKVRYPHDDRTINSVYDLLDIDQKNYINKEDINTFLSQIEEAEVDNYEEVSEELWRLFEGADFNNQHKLTYWHFYLVKSSEEFERVSQLLGEFEFQIERNQ